MTNLNFAVRYSPPSVSVEDLWAVYPELESGSPTEFAKEILKAAQWIKGHNALHGLRDGFEFGAVQYAANAGLFDRLDDEDGESVAT